MEGSRMCGLLGRVVRKGVGGDFILCGLSPPVSPRPTMVSQYTFGPDARSLRFEVRFLAIESNPMVGSLDMASPAPIVVPPSRKPLFGGMAAFTVHSVIAYTCALHLSPWLVFHWFGWIAPILSHVVALFGCK
jgi:hypothetical protein